MPAEAEVEARLDAADRAADPREAARCASEAWSLAQRSLPARHPLALGALRAAGLHALAAQRLDAARAAFETFLKLLPEPDPRRWLAEADLAMTELAAGDGPGAERRLTAVVDALEALDEPGAALIPPLGALAVVQAQAQDGLPRARRTAARVFDLAYEAEGEGGRTVADALLFSALLDRQAGDPRGAGALARRATELYAGRDGTDAPRALAWHLVAEAEAAVGRRAEAEAARGEARRLGDTGAEDLEAALVRWRPGLPPAAG